METLDHDFQALMLDNMGVCLAARSDAPGVMDVVIRIQSGTQEFRFSCTPAEFVQMVDGLKGQADYMRPLIGAVRQ